MPISYKPKTILAMLPAAVIVSFFCYFFFYQIEQIIHMNLYDYGLMFSNVWANSYSFYASIYLISLTLAWILFGSSIILFLGYEVNKNNRWRYACISLLVGGAILSFLNYYIFYRIDYLVNHDLYLYGLTFNVDWYSNYSLNLVLLCLLTGLAGIFALTPVVLLSASTREKRTVPARLFDSVLIAIGTAILALSIVYSSSILALIGLGLLFLGVTFTYVTTSEYVKKALLDTTVLAQQVTLNRIAKKIEYRGNTLYLPPQFFNTADTYKAFISKNKLEAVPTPEMLPKQEPDLFFDYINDPPAVLVTPPGAELAQLFEKALEKDFMTTSLQDLQRYLPELLIENLEVTPYFDMQLENDLVHVTVDDSFFRVPNAEIELSSLYFFFNSPLVCAIACVLSKATGFPVRIIKSKIETKGKIVTVDYRLLKEVS
jgi:hypothetical protein